MLEYRGLGDLNQRLLHSRRNVWDTIAEHNVGAILLRRFGRTAKVSYEPPCPNGRPIDFRLELNGTTFWIQVKCFSRLARENQRDNILDMIEQGAANINIAKFFSVDLAEHFSANDVPQFLKFLADTAANGNEGETRKYVRSNQVAAQVEFWKPIRRKLDGLTLGSASGMNAVNVTGLSADQMRSSIRKAAGAFSAPLDSTRINVIMAEAENCEDIDVGDACFGTEYELDRSGAGSGWSRMKNGVFEEPAVRDRVAGLIALRRTKHRPVSEYRMTFFINNQHSAWEKCICSIFPIAEVIRHNTYM